MVSRFILILRNVTFFSERKKKKFYTIFLKNKNETF